MLPHIARPDERDRLSTTGFAIGYLGGGTLPRALHRPDPRTRGSLGIAGPDGALRRVGFVVVAVWWLVFTLPFFFRVPEPPLAIEPDERPARTP